MPYDFKAGTISYNGLILALGVTSEKEKGLMEITSKDSWITKLRQKSFLTGPTGDWKNEWHSVYQFLDYISTGQGRCYVGATGSTGSYTGFSLSNTPLHNTSLVELDVVFDSGNTFSAAACANIANTRKDCLALIGNIQNLTDIDAVYDSEAADFGLTFANSEYVSLIGGRKQIDNRIDTSYAWPSQYITLNCTSDVAGLMAKNSNLTDISTIVAGVGETKRFNNVITLTQTLTDTEVDNLKINNINPIRQFTGFGTYMMGNKTYKNDSTLVTNRLNIVVTLNYIKRNIKNILREYLFGPNNERVRSTVETRLSTFLSKLFMFTAAGGGTAVVVCNDTNNGPEIIAQGKLVVSVRLTIPPSTESIELNVVNTEDGSTIYDVTII